MRPKKDVIVYCKNQLRLSLVSFPLGARAPYSRVVPVSSKLALIEAIERSTNMGCVVVLRTPGDEAGGLDIRVPCVEVLMANAHPVVAGSRPLDHPTDTRTLIDAVTVANSRKRGPKRKEAA